MLSPSPPRERAGVRGLFSLVPKLELGNEAGKPTNCDTVSQRGNARGGGR
jgi:hypothetical protein